MRLSGNVVGSILMIEGFGLCFRIGFRVGVLRVVVSLFLLGPRILSYKV